jgi:hypothetical protein
MPITPTRISIYLLEEEDKSQSKLTASRAKASISCLLGLLISTLAKVISTGMDDDSALKSG